MRVLICDTDAGIVSAVSGLCTQRGYASRAAYRAADVAIALNAFDPDLVFMDLGMPGIDSLEMARMLRSRFGQRPRLVALAASNGIDSARATAAGFDVQLSKPLEPSALSAALG